MRAFLIGTLGLGLAGLIASGTGCSVLGEDTESASPQLTGSATLVIRQVFGGSLGPTSMREARNAEVDSGPVDPGPDPEPEVDAGDGGRDPEPTVDAGPAPETDAGDAGTTPKPSRARYVELFNRGTATVNLKDFAIQTASATGGFAAKDALGLPDVELAPGKHYLVQIGGSAPTSTRRSGRITPDTVFVTSTEMTEVGGKVAIVNATSLLDSCGAAGAACAAEWVDLVGYGGEAATAFEGEKPVDALTSTSAAIRKNGGCEDSNDNFKDFDIGEPSLLNSEADARACATDVPVEAGADVDVRPPIDASPDVHVKPPIDAGPDIVEPPVDAGPIIIIIVGEAGPPGPPGDKGDKGDTGDKGDKGDRGDKGDKGDKGADGKAGADGKNGKDGENGPVGPVGPNGAGGPAGKDGKPGRNGKDGGCSATPGGANGSPASPLALSLAVGLVLARLRRRKTQGVS